MNKLYFILILALLFSCDDSSDENLPVPEDGPRNYYSANVGSHWYYETYADDTAGRDSLVSKDSIVVEAIVDFKGKEALKCRIFKIIAPSTSYEDSGNFYLATEIDRLYVHSEGLFNLLGAGGDTPIGSPSDFLEIEEQWILIGDRNQDRWDAFESEIEFQFGPFDVEGESEAKGRRISTSSLENIAGTNYRIDEYDINNEGVLSVDFGLPVPAEVDFEIDYTIQIGNDLGIYNIKTFPSDISIPGQELPEPTPTEQRLIRFNIVK